MYVDFVYSNSGLQTTLYSNWTSTPSYSKSSLNLATPHHKRQIMNALLRSSSVRSPVVSTECGDLNMRLDVKNASALIGQDMVIEILLTNDAREERALKVYTRINAAMYNGTIGRNVRSEWDLHKVDPGSGKIL